MSDEIEDPIKMLGDLLREAGARPTLDRRRSIALPCWRCNTSDVPRDLVTIGRYTRPMGGNLLPGDAIRRPLCARCRAETEPTATPAWTGPEPLDLVADQVALRAPVPPARWPFGPPWTTRS